MRKTLLALCLCLAPWNGWAAGDVSDNVAGDMVAPTNGGTVSSAIVAPAGTAAAPGVAVGTANKGMYDAGSNTLGFSTLGGSVATFDSSGNFATAGSYTLPAAGALKFGTRSQIQSSADSYLVLLDSAGTAFTGLRFGGTSASFPMWKRATTTLSARLADDSADADILAGALTTSGTITQALASSIRWVGSTQLFGASNRILRITNTGDTSPTSGVSGIVVGTTSVGSSLVYDSTYGWRSMNFNQTANSSFVGASFAVSNVGNVNLGVNPGIAGETGLGFPSTTSLALRTNALLAFGIDATQNLSIYGTGGSTGTNAGATFNYKSVAANTTLNLAGVATTIATIPSGATVHAAVCRVTTAITAAVSTTWTLTAGSVTFATAKAFALGTTVTSADYQASFVGPTYYSAATPLVVTLNSDTATAGVVRCVAYYTDATAPTS